MSWVAGVDGCAAGWFVAFWDGKGHWKQALCQDFNAVLACTQECAIVGIDIPIGLLDAPRKGGRTCDRIARRLLGGPRNRSVFSPPCRRLLALCQAYEHEPKQELFRRAQRLQQPVGLTRQAFALLPRLCEVDREMDARLQRRVREVHPELCFFAMNDGRSMRHSKHSNEGRAERIALLERLAGWHAWYETLCTRFARTQFAIHDMLDASAAAWSAWRIHAGQAVRIPAHPPRDAKGLRMEIWY